jgi:hypothetical protein
VSRGEGRRLGLRRESAEAAETPVAEAVVTESAPADAEPAEAKPRRRTRKTAAAAESAE